LTAQTRTRFEAVMRPKVSGTWYLHTLTQDLSLDFFICFSSIASMLGSSGQSNYATANAFMDTLMQQRHQIGLPGLSINWGGWDEVGLAAHLGEKMRLQDMSMISPQQGRQLLRYLLQQPPTSLAGQIGVIPRRHTVKDVTSVSNNQEIGLCEVLADLPMEERQAHLHTHIHHELAAVLGLRSDTTIDANARLFDAGLDSLMAVELKNRLESRLEVPLPSTLLFDYPTLDVLGHYLLNDILALGADSSESSQVHQENQIEIKSEKQSDNAAITDLSGQDLLAFIANRHKGIS